MSRMHANEQRLLRLRGEGTEDRGQGLAGSRREAMGLDGGEGEREARRGEGRSPGRGRGGERVVFQLANCTSWPTKEPGTRL